MDLKKLLGLRPKDDTAAALKAAMAQAESETESLRARIAELERDRGRRLLDGDAAEVEAAERDLATAQAEAARVAAMLPALRQRIEAAEAEELRVAALAAHGEAVKAADTFNAWWRAEYAELAGKLRAGLLMEEAALAASSRYYAAAQRAGAALPNPQRAPDAPIKTLWANAQASGLTAYSLGAFVRLPPQDRAGYPQDSGVAFWPPPSWPSGSGGGAGG
jgi:chromosome segregation ATPase